MSNTKQYHARRLLILLNCLDDDIKEYNIVGIAMWSREVVECVLYMEFENNLRG